MDLLGGEDSDSEGNDIKINTNYATRYDVWRKNEEYQKLKDKYGDVGDETSSTSEEEDEDAVELTEDVERDFFKTLSCLKAKNPLIYDENVKFFKEKSVTPSVVKPKKKEETLTMAAYQRKMLLETRGEIEPEHSANFEDMPLAHQEKALKNSFKEALQDSDSDDDGLLLKKERTAEEKAEDEADYRQWLAGQDANVDEEDKSKMKVLRDYWTDPKLDDGEKFLRDYILNHKYLESDINGQPENVLSSDSEEDVDEQEKFEHKYNFRFQEPDQDFIKRYPRTVEQSMRKSDDRRKKKREEIKIRKEMEKTKKAEELKRLKALKKAEIMEKIDKLKKVTGNDDLPFKEVDVEGEFNPDEHDQRMSELFGDEFYGVAVDEEKPEFHDLDEELEIENWDEWGGPQSKEELHCEDPGFVMDCDYDQNLETQNELIESTKKRKRRRQSKFAAAAAAPKPVFDPKNKTFEQYLDEYYALDYEDLIGDIPCRFKYRKVVPNDFGLSVEEILAAPDKELNNWVSVKKIMRRQGEDQELYDVQAYRKKAQSINKKMRCLPSLFIPPEEEKEEQVVAKKKRKKNKKNGNLVADRNGAERPKTNSLAVDSGKTPTEPDLRTIRQQEDNTVSPSIKGKKRKRAANIGSDSKTVEGAEEIGKSPLAATSKKGDKIEKPMQKLHNFQIKHVESTIDSVVKTAVSPNIQGKKRKRAADTGCDSKHQEDPHNAQEVSQAPQVAKSKRADKIERHKLNKFQVENIESAIDAVIKKEIKVSKTAEVGPKQKKFKGVFPENGQPLQNTYESEVNFEETSKTAKKINKKLKDIQPDNVKPMLKANKAVHLENGDFEPVKLSKKEEKVCSPVPKKKKLKKFGHTEALIETNKKGKSEGVSDVSKPRLINKKKQKNKSANKAGPAKMKSKSGSSSGNKTNDGLLSTLSNARLKSFGINPKKFKNKLKYGNKK